MVSRQLYFNITIEEMFCFMQEKTPQLCGFRRFANAYLAYKIRKGGGIHAA